MTSPASVDTPAAVDKAEPVAVSAPSTATPMPGAEPSAAAEAASQEPASLASEIARRRLACAPAPDPAVLRRHPARLRPGFRRRGRRRGDRAGDSRRCSRSLLDDGMKRNGFPLWLVPIAIIGLTVIRGLAGFVSQYGLDLVGEPRHPGDAAGDVPARPRRGAARSSRATRRATSSTRSPSRSRPAPTQLVYSLQSLVGDSLALRRPARLPGLAQLAADRSSSRSLLPAVAYVMRRFSRRLHRLTVEGQHSVDELAYVVEENVLAWRIVRLHGGRGVRRRRASTHVSDELRRLSMKSAVAAATLTPITQVLAACALAAVIVVGALAERRAATARSAASSPSSSPMLHADRADQAPLRDRRADHARPGRGRARRRR